MHYEWQTGSGSSLSWGDRIRDQRGDQREAARCRSCQITVLPLPGHSPATTPPPSVCYFPSIQQSFSTASFNIKGNDKWGTSPHKALGSQNRGHRGVDSAHDEIKGIFLDSFELFSHLKQKHSDFTGSTQL